jgi:hypothetical protein
MHDEKQNKERKKIMKVTLMPGIESISGSFKQKNGTRVVFTTRKAATTSKEDRTRMYAEEKLKKCTRSKSVKSPK